MTNFKLWHLIVSFTIFTCVLFCNNLHSGGGFEWKLREWYCMWLLRCEREIGQGWSFDGDGGAKEGLLLDLSLSLPSLPIALLLVQYPTPLYHRLSFWCAECSCKRRWVGLRFVEDRSTEGRHFDRDWMSQIRIGGRFVGTLTKIDGGKKERPPIRHKPCQALPVAKTQQMSLLDHRHCLTDTSDQPVSSLIIITSTIIITRPGWHQQPWSWSWSSPLTTQVTPAINLTACKYELKLEVPSAEGMTEMYLRFNSVSAFDCVFFNGNDADGENFENDRKIAVFLKWL